MPSSKNIIKCVNCLCKSGPFYELSENELINMNRNRVEVSFKKGETIFKQGSMVAQMAYIKKGMVKISQEHGSQELVIALAGRGQLVGVQFIFSSSLIPYSIIAMDDVSVCLLEISAINQTLEENPKFASAMLRVVNDETNFLYGRMACLSLKQLHGRFADLLLCLSLRIYKRKVFSTPLSKKDMAMVTNMSQESFSRVIKDFVSDKIIEFKGNQISILNYEKIRHLSLVG